MDTPTPADLPGTPADLPGTPLQHDALSKAGVIRIFTETASGANDARLELAWQSLISDIEEARAAS